MFKKFNFQRNNATGVRGILSEKLILASFLYVVALLFFFQNGLTCYSIASVIHSVESNVTSGIDTFAVFIRENIREIGEK